MEDQAVDGMSDRLAFELRRATIARSRAEHRLG
jgi:hypothetical protein